jgi:hypothetical protein
MLNGFSISDTAHVSDTHLGATVDALRRSSWSERTMKNPNVPQIQLTAEVMGSCFDRLLLGWALLSLLAFVPWQANAAQDKQSGASRFQISYSADANPGPITGRLVLVLATKNDPEPRLTISPNGPAILGADLDHLPPGQTVSMDAKAEAYPVKLNDLPPGDYYAQAIIDVYTQVHRADDHTIWVHTNDGRQETFNIAVGNLYSDVVKVHLGSGEDFKLRIDHVIPAPKNPEDTAWVKHVRILSERVSAFWGRPVYINATVLLPKGYNEHPDARYPTVYTMGHDIPFTFDPTPEPPSTPQQMDTRGLESGYQFYQSWTGDHFPRMIAVSFQQQTPFFPDSYSVNSANQGPYGDAMVQEVIPYLEAHFRMIGKPYARLVEGASTGGWQTLALQLQHPDFFGGVWVLQPDPISFRHYQMANIYEDRNAFSVPSGPFTSAVRPMRRTTEGQVTITIRELSLYEAVLGSHGRSGYQLEAWEAIYGPVGTDGYPVPLWDKATGEVNREVAAYMRDHGYDLLEYSKRNWSTLGPQIVGKLHFFCGDMDHFYLNLAVYDYEAFLKQTANPHYEAEFTYGRPMKGHGWHAFTWAEMVTRMANHVKGNAPHGENNSSWNY